MATQKMALLGQCPPQDDFTILEAKITKLARENAKIAEIETRSTIKVLTVLKAIITELETEKAKIVEHENRPTKSLRA